MPYRKGLSWLATYVTHIHNTEGNLKTGHLDNNSRNVTLATPVVDGMVAIIRGNESFVIRSITMRMIDFYPPGTWQPMLF